MRALFVMDPLSTVNVDADSSYMLMLDWQSRGGEVWHCGPDDLRIEGNAMVAAASRLQVGPKPKVADVLERRSIGSPELDVVFKRTDPPFDMSYVFCTYMLDVAQRHCRVVNGPSGLRTPTRRCSS